MKFDKSKVYSAVNADELEVGDVVVVDTSLPHLKKVIESIAYHSNSTVTSSIIISILDDTYEFRIKIQGSENAYFYAYLITKHDDPLKDVKAAVLEGKVIQYRLNRTSVWGDMDPSVWGDMGLIPTFDDAPSNYRVKPDDEEQQHTTGEDVLSYVKEKLRADPEFVDELIEAIGDDVLKERLQDDILAETDIDDFMEAHDSRGIATWVKDYISDNL